MFYAHFVLSKKGPLAKIWLAAHWDKKLTKAHVFETNIESSVEGILQPKVKMALRTSGHLLLGIVRIYSRKAKYLLADCNEAFIKIKMAFRPGIVDLPEGNREAAVATITLPEVFHDFDTAMPDITIDMDAQVSLNQSRAEDITLKEDYGTLSLITEDGFEEFDPETNRDGTTMEDDFVANELYLNDVPSKDQQADETTQNVSAAETTVVHSRSGLSAMDVPVKDDGFGGTIGEGLLDGETGALFEPAGLFDDAPLGDVSSLQNPETTEPQAETVTTITTTAAEAVTATTLTTTTTTELEKPPEGPAEQPPVPPPQEDESSDDDDMYGMAPGSTGAPSPPTSPETPPASEADIPPVPGTSVIGYGNGPHEHVFPPDTPANIMAPVEVPPPAPPTPAPPVLEQTTLIQNEDESFALAPLDTTIHHGSERTVKAKRKRKLIVDEVKNISGEEMKSQLSDTSDIVTTLDLAPPTKRLMQWKETGGVEKLFALPGHRILSRTLSRAYQRHLTTRSAENEDFNAEDNFDLDTDVEHARDDPDASGLNSRKRPRRETIDQSFPPELQIETSHHQETPHPSFANESSLVNQSLDYMQPGHPMFPTHEDQLMRNMMQNTPAGHLMMPGDVNQLGHIPDIMNQSMGDQGPPLHSITPTIQNDPSTSAVPPEAYNHHFPSDLPDHMQPPPMDKQMPNHINQQNTSQNALSDFDNLIGLPNHVHAPIENEIQPTIDNHPLNSAVDEDATQPCVAGDYGQPLMNHTDELPTTMPSVLPNSDHVQPIISNHLNDTSMQNGVLPNESNQQSELNTLFDTLHNGDIQNELPMQNDQPNDDGARQKTNELHHTSDDEDDYGNPGSVGPIMPEEQMADETYEQFEERVLTKRTTHMLHLIKNKIDQEKTVNFSWLVKNNKRKQVAQKFYTFLVLKKLQAVELEQDSSYGVMVISKGPKFDAVYNSN